VIGLTGVSLPTGQKYYGDGSGLTNLNAGGGSILTNGGNSGSAFYSIDPGVWGESSEAFGIAANALGKYSFAAGEQAAANGSDSTAIGYSAGVNLAGAAGVAIGFQATVTSTNGVAIGAGAYTDTGIAIGEGVIVSGPQVVLGNANITNTILQGVVNGNGAGLTFGNSYFVSSNLFGGTSLNTPLFPIEVRLNNSTPTAIAISASSSRANSSLGDLRWANEYMDVSTDPVAKIQASTGSGYLQSQLTFYTRSTAGLHASMTLDQDGIVNASGFEVGTNAGWNGTVAGVITNAVGPHGVNLQIGGGIITNVVAF
jgi:hypothetical protein